MGATNLRQPADCAANRTLASTFRAHGASPANNGHISKKHNSTVQLAHTMIRRGGRAFKGGAALHRSPLTRISYDAGVISQTTSGLRLGPCQPRKHTRNLLEQIDLACFSPSSTGYVDVFIDQGMPNPTTHGSLGAPARRRNDHHPLSHPLLGPQPIDSCQTPLEGQGSHPGPRLREGRPERPTPRPHHLRQSHCSLLLAGVGFVADLNLKAKLEEKTAGYAPLRSHLRIKHEENSGLPTPQ